MSLLRQRYLFAHTSSITFGNEFSPSELLELQRRKKKIGRPVAYVGDPDSEELSPAQRRKVKRRIANRESARRTLLRHKDSVDALTDQVCCCPQAGAQKVKRVLTLRELMGQRSWYVRTCREEICWSVRCRLRS